MKNLDREINWLVREKYGGPFDELRAGKIKAQLDKDIARLKRGEPVDYVIGWADFLGLKIDLAARPLIPRPETEYWTEKVIARLGDHPGPDPGSRILDSGFRRNDRVKILDIFCGSGCIGLAVLAKKPRAKADFADIDRIYFPGIRRSARSNKISSRRFRLIRSDIFKNISGKYNYILANPPYIPSSGRRVQSSVKKFEPRQAVFAGRDGLKYIRPLLREAKAHLKPGGELILEFDPPQKNAKGAPGGGGG